jgi:hypothetical protein
MLSQDPVNGGQLAAEWGTRETFVAVLTTNMPMIFPLLRTWFGPYLPRALRSSSNNKAVYKSPGSGFVSIGGGGSAPGHRQHGLENRISANRTFENDSEEHIVKGHDDVEMQYVQSEDHRRSPNGIVVSKKISVTTEESTRQKRTVSFQRD